MSKTKYKYNPATLTFEKVEANFTTRLFGVFRYTATSFLFATLIYSVFIFWFDSPKVRHLKKENRQLISQYAVLDKKISEIDSVFRKINEQDDNIYRTIFGIEPIPSTIREAGFGGINRYLSMEGYENSEVVLRTAKKADKLLTQIYIQEKSYEEIMNMAYINIRKLRAIPAIQPIENKNLKRIASGYGIRFHPILRYRKMHCGMDFTAPKKTNVFATGYGVVKKVHYSKRGYGNMVIIDHGFGYETVYAHLYSIFVEEGKKVKRGQIIATVGNTGFSTGPHLHYEIHKNGIPVNPVNYYFNDVSAEQFAELKKMANADIIPFD